METWLVRLVAVLVALVFLALLPCIIGVFYRACTRKCNSEARLDGKTVVVTGASAGIGRETALFLAGRGARVIMACRNLTKAQPVADSIIARTGNHQVVVRLLDVSDMTSVRAFAQTIIEEEESLHILVNNAGIILRNAKVTSPQGFELTMATNHYGCFLLTNLLLDKLKASAPSRIVTVASVGYMLNNLDVDDLNYERRPFDPTTAYCQSKICNILFTKELARRLKGTGVTANCLHPGGVATDIFNRENKWTGRVVEILANISARTALQGAQTSIYLALSDEVEGKSGGYYDNCKKTSVYRKANDTELARKLWDQTSKDVGLTAS